MIHRCNPGWRRALLAAALVGTSAAWAGVTADEAAALKTTLTPLGGERAGNREGTIPAWTGGLTTLPPGFKNGGRRPDPFPNEKPLYSVNAKNSDQHAERLTEGTKALLKKYPNSFRIDVYPTHRTAVAPQWVYDNTFKNATRAKVVQGPGGPVIDGAYGGIPFPIPKTGEEAMLNHIYRFKPTSFKAEFSSYLMTADGTWLKVLESEYTGLLPYYLKDGTPETFKGEYGFVRTLNSGPPIRAGEAILGRLNVSEDKSMSWVYLTGQRRVRKLPNPCCDTPTPFSAGVVSFDEVELYTGRLDRFDWKLVGKKEMLVPYNSNRINVPSKDAQVLSTGHLNPDHVRWELHRVWVVEATLRAGQRHPSVKSRYYLDEDTWTGLIAERYDANGTLARVPFSLPISVPDVPGVMNATWGVYDLISGASYVSTLMNERSAQITVLEKPPADTFFTPEAMAADNAR
jgi:hypothetical protein